MHPTRSIGACAIALSWLAAVPLWAAPPERASLAAYQSPIKNQAGRDTCYSFAAVAALEAAYKRGYGLDLDLSEQYAFHMGKAGELYADYMTSTVPHENNSSFWGFQGNSIMLKFMERFSVPTEADAPYLSSTAMLALRSSIPTAGALGFDSTQEQLDAFEFSSGNIPPQARERARYRVVSAAYAPKGDTAALETIIAGGHEILMDINLKWRWNMLRDRYEYNKDATGGMHEMLLIGYDRIDDNFIAKNSWGESEFIKLSYELVAKAMTGGTYITAIAPPTAPVDQRARWLGRWQVDHDGWIGELVIRRFTNFRNTDGNAPTKIGTYYRGGVAYDVNGSFQNEGRSLTFYIADAPGRVTPGSFTGQRFEVHMMGREYGVAGGVTEWASIPFGVRMSRYGFAALPAGSPFNVHKWLSSFDMSHDGWHGRLAFTDYSYTTPSGSAPYWLLYGTYTQDGRAPLAVTGKAFADRPHRLDMTVPFSAELRQRFVLHYHTREENVFSGVTWWSGYPFGVVGQ